MGRTADHADEALAWADRALAIATAARYPSGIANSHHLRGLAVRHTDPISARIWFEHALELASMVHRDHMTVDASLTSLAQVTTRSGEIGDALRCCRDAIASAARYRFDTNTVVALQYGIVTLIRAGDPDTAAALLGCIRSHGYRVWQTTQTKLDQALGDRAGNRPRGPESMLDAAELALAAIDMLL